MRPARTMTFAAFAAMILSLSVVSVSPAGAFEVLDSDGSVGVYVIKDTLARPGASCRFEDHALHIDEELDGISVRRLRVFGPRDRPTWVGYRVSVLQRTAASSDYEFVHRSKVIKRQASKTTAARFGRRQWTAPEELPASDFRVLVTLTFYTRSSKTDVRGRLRGVLEVYRHAHPAETPFRVGSPGDGGECYYNFWT